MILKIGSKGKEVKSLQEYLGIYADGDFGPNTEKYVKEWQAFTDKYLAKVGTVGSVGVGQPVVGKTNFSHFVWSGAPDIATALKQTKQMYSDPLFAEFAKKVSSNRNVVSTYMMQRLITFN